MIKYLKDMFIGSWIILLATLLFGLLIHLFQLTEACYKVVSYLMILVIRLITNDMSRYISETSIPLTINEWLLGIIPITLMYVFYFHLLPMLLRKSNDSPKAMEPAILGVPKVWRSGPFK